MTVFMKLHRQASNLSLTPKMWLLSFVQQTGQGQTCRPYLICGLTVPDMELSMILTVYAQEGEKDEDDEEEDTTWQDDGVDNEEEDEEHAPDQERIESHSKAGPHSRRTGAA